MKVTNSTYQENNTNNNINSNEYINYNNINTDKTLTTKELKEIFLENFGLTF